MADTGVLRDATAIAGIGQTPWAKHLPQSELGLALQAISAALDDAGIEPHEVDGLSSYTLERDAEVEVARNLGLGDLTWWSQVGYGGGAGCAVVGHAAEAVATGQANVVVAWRARKRGSATTRPWANVAQRVAGPGRWSRPWGLLRPVDEIAMLTRRYLHTYGGSREQLGRIAIAVRGHANRNPAAMMHDRVLDLDTYLAARFISEPLCLYDNCLESDGAAAVVVVSAERARDLRQPPVLIHAYAQGLAQQHQTMTNYFTEDPLRGPGWACAAKLWASSDLTPADVPVAQLYDAFSPLIALSLEAYGFCERGEGLTFAEERGLTWPDGELPVNTSGGGLSEAYVHGFNLITEGVRQVRGTSLCQVPDPSNTPLPGAPQHRASGAPACLVTSGEGVPTSALLLRAAP